MRWRPTKADRTGACCSRAQRGRPSVPVRACANESLQSRAAGAARPHYLVNSRVDGPLLNPASHDARDVVWSAALVRALDQAIGGGGQIGRAGHDLQDVFVRDWAAQAV